MKAYVYINPKAPAEVKDLLAEHFSDVGRVSSAFMGRPALAISASGLAGTRELDKYIWLPFRVWGSHV
jgi:hypothetical protein